MAHGYHRSFTHLVWTTWNREPLLEGHIEQEAYALIQSQCRHFKVTVHALGGIADHVHLLVSLPRTLCLADFMESVKGISSKALNDTHGSPTWAFRWQGGYSDHSVSPSQVTLIKHYIETQKEHHANHSLWLSCEPAAKPYSATSDAREGGELHFQSTGVQPRVLVLLLILHKEITMPKTVVLVYSGGLDTSVAIPMMREDYGFDRIVTVTVDVGQPAEDVHSAEDRAKALGCEHYTADVKAEFVENYCWPAVKANGDYQGYPLSTAIARPLIALKAVEVAKQVGADAFCHGCTGKGNDQFRIEYVMRALLPDTPIIAPMREHNYTRTEEIEYARVKNIPISVSADKIWSIDENLWGRSIEGGHLEEPSYAPPEEIFLWTKGIESANAGPQLLTVGFENGIPVSLDGERMDGLTLVTRLNTIAGDNGVGRVDIMEDRLLGLKVRENYECPASTVLIKAHAALESLVATAAERKFKATVDQQWGELAYYGLWFDPLKDDLEAFINKIQERVTGTVTLRLFKSSLTVIGRSSEWALYNEDLASFDSKTFDQRLSVGNVQTHGMQSRMYWALKEKHGK